MQTLIYLFELYTYMFKSNKAEAEETYLIYMVFVSQKG